MDSFDECITEVNEWLEIDGEKEYILSLDNIRNKIHDKEIKSFLNLLCYIVLFWQNPNTFGGNSTPRKFFVLFKVNNISNSMALFDLLIEQGKKLEAEYKQMTFERFS